MNSKVGLSLNSLVEKMKVVLPAAIFLFPKRE